jgi:hypothetical protein
VDAEGSMRSLYFGNEIAGYDALPAERKFQDRMTTSKWDDAMRRWKL